MNLEKDYYFILGVLQTAEDAVIRAAFKALSQKYHPDKNQERKEFAEKKMSEINEAYRVLSNKDKRKEYDQSREAYVSDFNGYAQESGDYGEAEFDPFEADWKLATKYQPDLIALEKDLSRISQKLAFTYKAFLLTSKLFDQKESLAELFENQFLKIYFGENPEIIEFARGLIMKGNREAARELNKVIKVFGDSADVKKITSQISKDYELLKPIGLTCPRCMQLNSVNASTCIRCKSKLSKSR